MTQISDSENSEGIREIVRPKTDTKFCVIPGELYWDELGDIHCEVKGCRN